MLMAGFVGTYLLLRYNMDIDMADKLLHGWRFYTMVLIVVFIYTAAFCRVYYKDSPMVNWPMTALNTIPQVFMLVIGAVLAVLFVHTYNTDVAQIIDDYLRNRK